jgi:ketosteroid isomerase-like protein
VYQPNSLRFDVKSMYCDGGTVGVETLVNATTNTGRPYEDVDYISIFTVSYGGRIRFIREYVDGIKAIKAHFE